MSRTTQVMTLRRGYWRRCPPPPRRRATGSEPHLSGARCGHQDHVYGNRRRGRQRGADAQRRRLRARKSASRHWRRHTPVVSGKRCRHDRASTRADSRLRRGQKTVRVDPRSDKEDKARCGPVGVRWARRPSDRSSDSWQRLKQRDETEEDGPLALSTLVDGAIVLVARRRCRCAAAHRQADYAKAARRAPCRSARSGPRVFITTASADTRSHFWTPGVSSKSCYDRVDRVLVVEQEHGLHAVPMGMGDPIAAVLVAVRELLHVSVVR